MKEPIDNYFTTGELAKLCKIPRKTLLYYDSLGLITPEVIKKMVIVITNALNYLH